MESPESPNKNREEEVDELDDEYDSEEGEHDPNVFKIRGQLKQAAAKIYSTRELHTLIHEGVIDLTPPYQRDVVWPESKQIGLIDSLFRNYYVPPIIFAVRPDEDGEEIRICVDGKQRLTSIQKFFDGQIPHRDAVTKKLWWYTTSESARAIRSEVPENFKVDFGEKQIHAVEYYGLTPGAERDIFQRVQLGMALTAAEKMQAISSPWATWISYLEDKHVKVEGGLSEVLEWDTKRGRDFQNIAYLVYCCDGLPDTENIPTSAKMEKWLSRVDPPSQSFKHEIEEVLREFWNIAANPELNAGLKKIGKRLAPVEFIFIGALLYVLRKRTIEDKARAIYNLRTNIRAEYKDIRNNSTVGKSLWGHINNLEASPTHALFREQNDAVRGKKKRKVDVDEEEDEYRPEPMRNFGKTPKTRSKQARMG